MKIGTLDLPLEIIERISKYLPPSDQRSFTATYKYLYNFRYRTSVPAQPIGLLTYAKNWGLCLPPLPLGVYDNEGQFNQITALAPELLSFYIHDADTSVKFEEFVNTNHLAASLVAVKKATVSSHIRSFLPSNLLIAMPNLKSLEIFFPSLSVVPQGLTQLTQLEELRIGYGWGDYEPTLEHTPSGLSKDFAILPSIGELKNLRHLTLCSDALKKLPDDIGELKQLVSLDFLLERLEELPVTLAKLTNLQALAIACHSVKFFPENFNELTQLVGLAISANKLESFPQIGMFKKLQFLEIVGGALKTLSNGIDELPKLKVLQIHTKQLEAVPDIERLTSLTHLDIFCTLMQPFYIKVVELTQLKTLIIRSQGEEILPHIGVLKVLEILKISAPYAVFPMQLQELQALKNLQSAKIEAANLEYSKSK